MLVWVLVLGVASTVVVGGAIGWSYVSREHAEAGNVSLDAVDFGALRDGTYTGEYAGGMYKWRASTVRVVVDSGKVTDIRLLNSSDPGKDNTDQASLFDRVIKAQSLHVDAISGATLTSKAYLKAVESALVNTGE